MKPLFADWISLTNPEDATHEQATVFAAFAQRSAIITTEEVLTEFLTFFSGRSSFWRAKAVSITRSILANTSVRALPQTHETFQAGLDFHAAPSRQGLSPDGLHLHANDDPPWHHGCPDR